MRRSRYVLLGSLVLLGLFLTERAMGRARRATTPNETAGKPTANERKIQVAILLDVSGSMSGLIAQTRTEMWRLVSELSKARAREQRPRLEMALYTFGRTDNQERGYIRQMIPFTSDLDRFSEALFTDQPAGGEEYCGEVIKDATNELEWSANPDDMKTIFIAGNESFRQGNVDPMVAIRTAAAKGITVNTIHCGDQRVGVDDGWQQGAQVASGKYMVIDHNQLVADIAAPQDAEIVRLNEELGKQYVPYGAHGKADLARRAAQDNNAMKMSLSSAVARMTSNANGSVCNGLDDDCDGAVDNELLNVAKRAPEKLAAVPDAELPAEIQGKALGEKQAWVARKTAEREQLQAKIRTLSADRQKYLASQKGAGQNTVGQAMIDAVHEQAARSKLSFVDAKQAP